MDPSAQALSPQEWRQSRQMSLGGAASFFGVTGKNPARTWQRWETGARVPPIEAIVRVEKLSGQEIKAADWYAVRQRFLNAACSAARDSRADRDAGLDQHPTPDTARSLEPDEAGASGAPVLGDVSEPSSQDPLQQAPVGAEQL